MIRDVRLPWTGVSPAALSPLQQERVGSRRRGGKLHAGLAGFLPALTRPSVATAQVNEPGDHRHAETTCGQQRRPVASGRPEQASAPVGHL
jgi:hypothetical protein